MHPAEKPPPVIKAEIPKTVVPAGKTPVEADQPMVQPRPNAPAARAEADPPPVKLRAAAPMKAKPSSPSQPKHAPEESLPAQVSDTPAESRAAGLAGAHHAAAPAAAGAPGG